MSFCAQGDSSDFTIGGINDYRIARGIKLPDAVPPSAGGLNKTSAFPKISRHCRFDHAADNSFII